MKISGAELMVALLERRGVTTVAGIPGGAVLPLYDALGRSSIRHVLARHEQAAGFIAQGMARVTGLAGVCIVTSGPGVTNVVTALADAKLDSVPLVCISGQVPTHLIGTDAFQEVATVDMVRPITKACFFVKSARDIVDVVAQAFDAAESGRPGPVLIDFPKDVQLESIDWDAHGPASPRDAAGCPGSSPSGDDAQRVMEDAERCVAYDRAAALIDDAKRPLLYCGGGVVKARALAIARNFAQRLDIPVTTTLMALGLMPPGHGLSLGMLGMHGSRFTNQAVDAADLIIAIGARFDDRATGDPARFATRAQIIHIDIDPHELGKIKAPTVAICDDAATAFRELLARTQALPASRPTRLAWRSYIGELRLQFPVAGRGGGAACSPRGIMVELGRWLTDDTLITTDVGQHQMWAAQSLPLRRADRWLTSGGLGTMGFGLPAAIGAALVSDGAPVICITGDGSLLMNVQELATLAELALNVKVLLFDNASLGMVRQQQALFYGGRYTASTSPSVVNWPAIAAAFGIPAHDIGNDAEVERVLAHALDRAGPQLIRVAIDENRHVMPMVPSGGVNIHPLEEPFTAEEPLVEVMA